MGHSSRRRLQRIRYGGLGYNYHPPETAEPDADLSETQAQSSDSAAPDDEPVIAPVLDLDGLEPWAEIRGPALALEEETDGDDEPVAVCDDPAQLALGALREMAADTAPSPSEVAEVSSNGTGAIDPASAALRFELLPDGQEAPRSDSADGPALPAVVQPAPPSPPPALRPDPLDLLFEEARTAADAGRGAEAKRICREVLAQRPSHVRARNEIARLLEAEGNQQAALAELDQALDLAPEDCGWSRRTPRRSSSSAWC